MSPSFNADSDADQDTDTDGDADGDRNCDATAVLMQGTCSNRSDQCARIIPSFGWHRELHMVCSGRDSNDRDGSDIWRAIRRAGIQDSCCCEWREPGDVFSIGFGHPNSVSDPDSSAVNGARYFPIHDTNAIPIGNPDTVFIGNPDSICFSDSYTHSISVSYSNSDSFGIDNSNHEPFSYSNSNEHTVGADAFSPKNCAQRYTEFR